MTSRRKLGFTLVELLVVIAIIGILAAMLLPAVNAAREQGRQANCKSNISNLGKAIIAHLTSHGRFPGGDLQTGRGWIVEVLPQLEQNNLYNQMDEAEAFNSSFQSGQGMRNAATGIGGQNLMALELDILKCPSDSLRSSRNEQQWGPSFSSDGVARTNYKGVLGGDENSGNAANPIDAPLVGSPQACRDPNNGETPCNGLFWPNSFHARLNDSDVRDGMSNTLMVGEDVPDIHSGHIYSAAYFADHDNCSTSKMLNIDLDLNPNPTMDDFMQFRSHHPGGVHFCLADGSVRFVADSTDWVVLGAISTRDGGEILTLDN